MLDFDASASRVHRMTANLLNRTVPGETAVRQPTVAGRRVRGAQRAKWKVLRRLAIAAIVATQLLVVPAPAAATTDVAGSSLLTEVSELPTATPPKVAVIVGPVGEELTPVYLEIAQAAAARGEELGATVERAYSPEATPENVLAAMEDANVVVYLGHGVGFPNPYSDTLDPEKVNGFGLQGPGARGDHSDSWQDGTLKYYGEAWLAAHARPAPGWVMIHSNVCYAPGAGEGFDVPASADIAAARVANYSRAPLTALDAGAYYATDLYKSAAELVGTILSRPDATFGEIFASESRYEPEMVSRVPHPLTPDSEIWLQRSAYFDGKIDYWYAFAGDPNATPASVAAPPPEPAGAVVDPAVTDPADPVPPTRDGVVVGMASHYPLDPGWENQPTVSLPLAFGAGLSAGTVPSTIVVCAERCATLLVVDTCDCLAGTSEERVINLSHRAWRSVSDLPLAEGLTEVTVHLGRFAEPSGSDAIEQ